MERGSNDASSLSLSPRSRDKSKRGVPRHRQWLYDRVTGKSKYGESRPPCGICWVPPPVKWFPALLEENDVCIDIGKIGLSKAASNQVTRSRLLYVGLFFNFVAFACTLYACLALSMDYNTLQSSSFSSAIIREVNGLLPDGRMDVGLRAAAYKPPHAFRSGGVKAFDQFCDLTQYLIGLDGFIDSTKCAGCAMVSYSMAFSVIIACISFIPTFSTDILRMYPNYDVNCQKSFATVLAFLSLLGSLNTLYNYNHSCFASFCEGYIYVSGQGIVVKNLYEHYNYNEDDDSIKFVLEITWHMGKGLICLYAGTVLKVMDIICHCLIPTPSITRSHIEQEEYEKYISIKALNSQPCGQSQRTEGIEVDLNYICIFGDYDAKPVTTNCVT